MVCYVNLKWIFFQLVLAESKIIFQPSDPDLSTASAHLTLKKLSNGQAVTRILSQKGTVLAQPNNGPIFL